LSSRVPGLSRRASAAVRFALIEQGSSPRGRGCCILPYPAVPVLTERDVIMRLVRQLAELLAAVLRLRREGRRDEALRQIDGITGRLTGMDAGALCLLGEAPLAGLPRELKLPLACVLRQRARLLRDARRELEARQAFGAARLLVRSARPG